MVGLVARRLARMGEVAGHDGEGGIQVVRPDVRDAAPQALARVQPVQRRTGRHEMRVGQVDELHAATPGPTRLLMMTLR